MTIRTGSILGRVDGFGYDADGGAYRVESVDGKNGVIRDLATFLLSTESLDKFRVRYQTDYFDKGDTVKVRREYADRYNEVDGGNPLIAVYTNTAGRVPITTVENNNGDQFSILTERLHLVEPAKQFKAGDRVRVDPNLAAKYDNDGIVYYWRDEGILTLTEDSGSRPVKTTSHVSYDNKVGHSNNVPTRWLKLAEEPAKRVVGEAIKAADVKVGDKVKAVYTKTGILAEFTGTVGGKNNRFGGETVVAVGGGIFPYESMGAVFTLLEEAPEPVDENLQRLLDAEIGDIAHGTYANEYWQNIGDDEWVSIGDTAFIRTADEVFGSLYKLKYGTLEIYKKVEER